MSKIMITLSEYYYKATVISVCSLLIAVPYVLCYKCHRHYQIKKIIRKNRHLSYEEALDAYTVNWKLFVAFIIALVFTTVPILITLRNIIQ